MNAVTALLLGPALLAALLPAFAQDRCEAKTGPGLNPVVELYTSEGCSSCPPADRWLSTLKAAPLPAGAVVEAFHVSYWDDLGWVDRFASPVFNQRQRDIAALNHQRSVYTPQLLRDGADSRDYGHPPQSPGSARAAIQLRRTAADHFEAAVAPVEGGARWGAYWTVTESGHSSRVKAGENTGAFLQHDFVVRQYTPVGEYRGVQTLELYTRAADPAHPRQINLVVFDPGTGRPLQALGMNCS